jgi:hypothetical protein
MAAERGTKELDAQIDKALFEAHNMLAFCPCSITTTLESAFGAFLPATSGSSGWAAWVTGSKRFETRIPFTGQSWIVYCSSC